MGDYYYLLNLCLKKQRKGRTLLFLLLQVENEELFTEGPGVNIKLACEENSRLVVVSDKQVSGLNYEDDILLK